MLSSLSMFSSHKDGEISMESYQNMLGTALPFNISTKETNWQIEKPKNRPKRMSVGSGVPKNCYTILVLAVIVKL